MKKLNALTEEWSKLEAEQKAENTTVQRGTGKYILEALFGGDKSKKVRRRRKRLAAKVDKTEDSQDYSAPSEEKTEVFIPLDAFKDYKYEQASRQEGGDLVEVVSLPSSYQGSTPPPSPRSLHALNSEGRKKKKDQKQIEEERRQLRVVNDEYMNKRRMEREQLMLDFSKLNPNIVPRFR